MLLNYIWIFFFIAGFIIALIRSIIYVIPQSFTDYLSVHITSFGSVEVFNDIVMSTYDMSTLSIKICIGLAGIMALWTGLMRVSENAGLIEKLSKWVTPVLSVLFPSLPKNSPVFGKMMMNFSANMLGLDNAATPLGLQAMEELQKLNKNKNEASDAQIMFLVLNTSGLTIIPISVMAIRSEMGASNPSDVFIPILIVTFLSTLAGITITSIIQKINLFKIKIISFLVIVALILSTLVFLTLTMSETQTSGVVTFIGNFILLFIISFFLYYSFIKKKKTYDVFIEGAKEGIAVIIKIAPYLIAILVGIGVFRASGGMNIIISCIAGILELLHLPSEFVDALPVGIMKPLSGSGARGLMIDVFNTHGVDSFKGFVASLMQGSTETTFYMLAVYFGAVNIRATRYAVGVGLFSDFVGVIAAIIFSYIFFA